MLEHHETEFPKTWTLDEVMGFLFSTSVASKKALGASAHDFEADLRSALLQHDPSGSYPATVTCFYRIAGKPKGRHG
jgi:hypothetical protein